MSWASWADFWGMGGRAFYVWGSFGVTLVLIGAEIVLLRKRRRTLVRSLSLMQSVTAEEEQ